MFHIPRNPYQRKGWYARQNLIVGAHFSCYCIIINKFSPGGTRLNPPPHPRWGETVRVRKKYNYSSIANCSTKAPAMGYLEFFAPLLKFLFVYSTRFSRTREILNGETCIRVTQQILSLIWNQPVYNNPVKNSIPNQENPVHTPTLFPRRYLHFILPSTRLMLKIHKLLISHNEESFPGCLVFSAVRTFYLGKTHSEQRRSSSGDSVLGAYASNTLLQIEHF
jgi:hypothetical protein